MQWHIMKSSIWMYQKIFWRATVTVGEWGPSINCFYSTGRVLVEPKLVG